MNANHKILSDHEPYSRNDRKTETCTNRAFRAGHNDRKDREIFRSRSFVHDFGPLIRLAVTCQSGARDGQLEVAQLAKSEDCIPGCVAVHSRIAPNLPHLLFGPD
jgi:hypothetical protein